VNGRGAPFCPQQGCLTHTETPCTAILKEQSLFFFKNGEQEGKTGPVWDWYQWEGVDLRKVWKRLNVVEILCTHVWKWPVETISGMGEGVIKENDGGGESNYDIL
jgi:hypothetical protein